MACKNSPSLANTEVPLEVEQGLQAVDLNQLEDLVEVALTVERLAQFLSRLSEG